MRLDIFGGMGSVGVVCVYRIVPDGQSIVLEQRLEILEAFIIFMNMTYEDVLCVVGHLVQLPFE